MKNYKKSFVLLSMTAIIVMFGCRTQFPVTTQKFTVHETVNLEHGKNLTFNVCGQCHYDYHMKSFIGEKMRDLPKFMGKVYSANLTEGHVLSSYNDAELFYLIKTGIARDGRFIPYMVRPTIADQDLKDIIAYLRSNDDPVKRNDSISGVSHLSFLGKLASKIGGKPQPYNTSVPQPTNKIEQGRYLVDIIGCYHCHSKSILGLNYMNPEDSKGYMSGGMKWNIDGERIYASNLTPDDATGIGKYDIPSFRKAVQDGIGLDNSSSEGRKLRYPMRHFKHLTNEQCDAIFAYLQKLQPVQHEIKGH